jgi:hypothetical protein
MCVKETLNAHSDFLCLFRNQKTTSQESPELPIPLATLTMHIHYNLHSFTIHQLI